MKKRLVNEKRVRVLKQGKVGAGPVIYWCSRDQRVQDNWAFIYACETAKSTGAPVAVLFSLVTSFLGAGARQFCFMLKGLQEMEKALRAMNIKFVLLEGDPLSHYSRLRQGVWREPHCHRPVSAETGEDMERCDCKFHRLPIS